MRLIYIIILIIGIVAQSCDPLDVKPTDLIPIEDAISDEKGLAAAMNGVYDGLQSDFIAQDMIIASELIADNLTPEGSKVEYQELFNNRAQAINLTVEGIWNAHYATINRANNVLAQLPNVARISETQRAYAEGQLLFIRALCHFNLVKSYGAVPIRIAPTLGVSDSELAIGRSPVTAVYERIHSDLDNAEIKLAGAGVAATSDLIGESAVKALQARVYLYESNWSEVVAYTAEVMDYDYELVDGAEYQSLFEKTNENDEIIFKISYLDTDVNTLADYFLPTPNGRFEAAVSANLANAYTASDLRKPVSAVATGAKFHSNKYTDFAADSDNSIVLRYADILLMRAEALNEIGYAADGEAFDLINAVRNRADLDSLTSSTTPNQSAFRSAIELERRLEFSAEGHRLYDLKRTDRALAVLSAAKGITSEKQLIFPIPQSELNTNKHPEMVQNN